MNHHKLLGVDFGLKRVGIAIGSTETLQAFPYQVIPADQAEDAVLEIAAREQVQTIVFGLPLNAAGELTPICQKVRRFARRIARRSNITVSFQDEYASSECAREVASGLGPIDAVAACLILQEYLQNQ